MEQQPGSWDVGWARELTVAHVVALLELIGADGHGIYAPEAVAACGVPWGVVARYAMVHRRSTAPRDWLVGVDGQPVAEARGVYGLALMRDVVRGLGLPVVEHPSRGMTAYGLARELAAWVTARGGIAPEIGLPTPTGAPPPLKGSGAWPVAARGTGDEEQGTAWAETVVADPEGTVRRRRPGGEGG